MTLEGKRILIIGGSSGMGLAVAQAAADAGADVIIAGRSVEKLQEAKKRISGGVEAVQIDVTDAASIDSAFARIGPIDHLVISGSTVAAGDIRSIKFSDAQATFDSKFWGAYRAVRAATLTQGGSVVLFSGIFSRRPTPGYSTVSAVNGAIEALGRGLALELAPVRVNVISPGLTDTPAYAAMPEAQRKVFFSAAADRMPVKRIGRPADIAMAVLFLLENEITTGVVLDVDGGSALI